MLNDLLHFFQSIWRPGGYHGGGGGKVFFEGWYVKLISADKTQRWALIPGVFHHPEPERTHAFLQVLNGRTSRVEYHHFPVDAFRASRQVFDLWVGDNHFHQDGCELDVTGEVHDMRGEVRFLDPHPWPVTLTSPGVMGPYAFVPFMQTYHGVLSLDHELKGSLKVDGEPAAFDGGRGYIEKDWGTVFPRAYIWMQSNHFQRQGVSLTASVATIPWLGSWFPGFLVGLWVEGTLYRFTTYLGSEITRLQVTDEEVQWRLRGTSRSGSGSGYAGYRLEITAQRGEGGLLSAPALDGMTPRILESLTAAVEVALYGLDRRGAVQEEIFSGQGDCAGLEVAGSVEELVSG